VEMLTKETQSSLVETLPAEYASKATVFVSHAYSYQIADVFEVILSYEASHPGRYYWFDPFSLNQHNPGNVVLTPDQLEKAFGEQIRSLGSVLIVASPWNDPAFLSRAWCLFELFVSVETKVQLEISLPTQQRKLFIQGLQENWRVVYDAFGRIDCRKARAREQRDLDAIFASIQRTVGFDYVNALALREMRAWLARSVLQEERRLQEESKDPLEIANFQHTEGILLWQLGNQVEAERVDRAALETRREILGPTDRATLSSLNQLALLLKAQGKFADAIVFFQEALVGFEAALGPSHLETILVVNNLASQFRMLGKLDEAEPLYRRALVARENALGTKHVDTLQSVNNLGYGLFQKGNLSEAEQLGQRAVTGREEVIGPKHPDTLESVHNLACVLHAQRKFDDAERLFRRAATDREVALGAAHPGTLTSLNNLASLLEEQDKLDDAEALARRVLAARLTALPSGHPGISQSTQLLARVLKRQAHLKLKEADVLTRQALESRQKKLGDAHPDTVESVEQAQHVARILKAWQADN